MLLRSTAAPRIYLRQTHTRRMLKCQRMDGNKDFAQGLVKVAKTFLPAVASFPSFGYNI